MLLTVFLFDTSLPLKISSFDLLDSFNSDSLLFECFLEKVFFIDSWPYKYFLYM